jgi:DNA-binding Xre family transcriptional regulator
VSAPSNKCKGKAAESGRQGCQPRAVEFAYTAGIEPTHYSHIETGTSCITLRTLFKICRCLRITPWELLEAALKHVWDEEEEKDRKE